MDRSTSGNICRRVPDAAKYRAKPQSLFVQCLLRRTQLLSARGVFGHVTVHWQTVSQGGAAGVSLQTVHRTAALQ